MTVTWEESRLLFSIKVKMDSHETKGLYNILNSTISVNISLLTPLSFRMRCLFTTYIYIQLDNYTKAHGLYQKGLLFEKLKRSRHITNTGYRTMTIHRKSNLNFNSVFNFNPIQIHHLSPLMSLISQ